MTILVTGSAGFIGSNFVLDWLEECDEHVISLDKLTYAGNLRNLASLDGDARHTFIRADIGDRMTVGDLLSRYRPRAVVNFAAESHVDRSIFSPGEFIRTNVVGTYNLLENIRAYWHGLDDETKTAFRFLHVSTDEVYGALSRDDPAFSETSPYRPNSPYSASKAASDHLVRSWHHTYGIPVLTTNCSNNYGPYQFPEKLIPLMILNALKGAALPVYGDGLNIRDWLFVKDHTSAIRMVLDRGRLGETYCIGGRAERTNLQVVNYVCELLDELHPRGAPHQRLISFVEDRPGHDVRYAIDCRKMEVELDWRPRETFETGMRKTVRWYLANTEWTQSICSGEYRKWMEANYLNRCVA